MAPNVSGKNTSNPYDKTGSSCPEVARSEQPAEKKSPLFNFYQRRILKDEDKILEFESLIAQKDKDKEGFSEQKSIFWNMMCNYRREFGSNMNDEQKADYKKAYDGYWSSCFAATSAGNSITTYMSCRNNRYNSINFYQNMQQGEKFIQQIKNQSQFGV